MIVSTNNESAKQELRDYYIKKLEPQHDGNHKYIKEESGKVYKGGDLFYNLGYHQKFFYTFKVLNTFSKAEIQEKI